MMKKTILTPIVILSLISTLTSSAATLASYNFNAGDLKDSTGAADVTVTGSPVPEPSSTALLGLGGLVLILRRRK